MSKGILLVNLGSPDSPEPKDVKRYLDQFLMDKRVIDTPYLLRAFVVKGIILNTRPKKSSEAYKKIWWEEGSPLIVLSEKLQEKVQKLVNAPVALAMRYGNPSIKKGLQELYDKGVTEVLLLPLYPQFAMATTETILVLAEKLRKKHFSEMNFTNIESFYNKESYIKVLSQSIKEALQDKDWEHLLFSYHGVPERHILKSDVTQSHCKIDGQCCIISSPAHAYCYRHQCYETTRKVVKALGLEEGTYSTSFQSRLGKDPWLQPYTDQTVEDFAKKGTKKLAIVTPAFVSDCLETLEEIGMEAKEDFLDNGGEECYVIPCLNDRDDWAQTIASWVDQWATTKPDSK